MKHEATLWAGIFSLAAALNILIGWHAWPAVFAGHLNDPDSYMRLVRLRDGIAAGHLMNVVARDDAGRGTLVEWSRLFDMLLWIMAAPLVPVLGWTKALFIAGVASGPLSVGALGLALAFAARPLAADALLWPAAVAAAVLPGLADFAVPGVVHYHILLLALIAASLGCALRARSGGVGIGFAAGALGGLAIWLTPETMPFILAGFAALFLRWASPGQQNRMGGALSYTAAGFVDVIGLGYVLDPPQGGYLFPEIDRLSIVYVVLALLFIAAAQFLQRLTAFRLGRLTPAVGLGVTAALFLAWIALFPQVAQGPYGLMSATQRAGFFGAMLETRPLHGPADFFAFLLPGTLAFFYTLWRAAADRAWGWAYAAAGTLVTIILADKFLLFTEFPAGIAAALLPVALSEAGSRLRARPPAAIAARVGLFALVLLAPALPALPLTRPSAPTGHYPSCDMLHIATLLGADQNAIVLAEAQNTPELLYRTPVKTVGSLYQHGLAGYFAARAAWRAAPGAIEPAAVRATRAALVAFCPSPGYAPVQGIPNTLWSALAANKIPPWLTLEKFDPATGWRTFSVHG